MAKRPRRSAQRPPVDDHLVVVVCRGGDCGNRTQHPGTDHAAQLRELRARVEPLPGSVVTSPCLDACEHANVVVVLPGREGRQQGGEPVWVGGVLDAATTDELVAWAAAGGPALAEPPVLVDLARFRPGRLSRHELDETLGR